MASLEPRLVINYVQNDSATPSKESSRLSELGGIISASKDALARRVDSGSLQLPPNTPQVQDEIENSEFKLPNLSSLFVIICGNALFQVNSVYVTFGP
jgi:hypothetical protein